MDASTSSERHGSGINDEVTDLPEEVVLFTGQIEYSGLQRG